jgi:hypothetical protein
MSTLLQIQSARIHDWLLNPPQFHSPIKTFLGFPFESRKIALQIHVSASKLMPPSVLPSGLPCFSSGALCQAQKQSVKGPSNFATIEHAEGAVRNGAPLPPGGSLHFPGLRLELDRKRARVAIVSGCKFDQEVVTLVAEVVHVPNDRIVPF